MWPPPLVSIKYIKYNAEEYKPLSDTLTGGVIEGAAINFKCFPPAPRQGGVLKVNQSKSDGLRCQKCRRFKYSWNIQVPLTPMSQYLSQLLKKDHMSYMGFGIVFLLIF